MERDHELLTAILDWRGSVREFGLAHLLKLPGWTRSQVRCHAELCHEAGWLRSCETEPILRIGPLSWNGLQELQRRRSGDQRAAGPPA